MSLAHELDRYLSVRRSLGADLRTDERILRRFVTFADNDGVTTLALTCSCDGMPPWQRRDRRRGLRASARCASSRSG
jgi:hypothetical protein